MPTIVLWGQKRLADPVFAHDIISALSRIRAGIEVYKK